MPELELKAVVPDPHALRDALTQAGAVMRFHGLMRDRMLDHERDLRDRDHVLRVRLWSAEDGGAGFAEIGWKGPTTRSDDGYKQRDEVECTVDDGEAALRIFLALGYRPVMSIDRYVEVLELDGTVARLEWYPRMDVLLEVEGNPEGIEQIINLTGMPREAFLPDSLATFAARFTERAGRPAILAEAELDGEPPGWMAL